MPQSSQDINERHKILSSKRYGNQSMLVDDLTLNGNISDIAKYIYHSNNIFEEQELRTGLFNKRYRYGILNPYQNLGNCREFLFFTKPDLSIYERNDENGYVNTLKIRDELSSYYFWQELASKYPEIIACLQNSVPDATRNRIDPFNHLLENMVQSNLDVPGVSAEMIETPSNMYGVNYHYRGSSEASDDGFDFSLEFKDTKYLPVYNFFKAYEEYEKLKHHGIIGPWQGYITNKVLHDQYCIYKFLTLDDMETIVYYAKYYGVKSKNLPREAFSNVNFDNGLSYSIDFNAAFVEDMNPEILIDFNFLSYPFWKECGDDDISIYDYIGDRVNMTPAQSAIVAIEVDGASNYKIFGFENVEDVPSFPVNGGIYDKSARSLLNKYPGRFAYKLKWRGSDII